MGRTTDVLRKGFRAAKCLTQLKLATSRIKVVRNKRIMSAKQMRGEIAQLIKSGQDAHVYITKADALIKQENMVAVYDLLDQYCHTIMSRFPAIELQRNCPADMKEAIASIIYAAPRCIELTELAAIKDAFASKYGKDFAAAATDLRPNCGVNTQVIELLSIRPATGDMKLKLMKEICKEHNIDWTPGEALAGPPAAAAGHPEARVEPVQATATLGNIKANAVGVGEAGPSKTTVLQGVSKPGASKSGLAEAVVSVTNASKTSAQKQTSSSEGDVATGKPSVSGSFKGVMSSASDSSKAAVFGTNASMVDDPKLSTFEEEDARRLRERILQSLKGGSFVESEIEAETNAKVSEKPMDAVAQVVMSDSDSDSFVSVEEGRFEDDVEPSLHGVAARKESFRDSPTQGFTEADLNRSSLSKKLSSSLQEDIYSRTSSKNSDGAIETHEVMLASSNFSTLPSESTHEGIPFKINSKKALNAEEALKAERTSDSLNRGKLIEAHSVKGLKKNTIVLESMDNFLRVSSKKSSKDKEMMEETSRKDSLNLGNLDELQSVEELSEDRKISEKVAEQPSGEAIDKEGLQGKDILEDKSAEATTESLAKGKLSERASLGAAEGQGDESCLLSEGIIEVTPSVATTEIKVVTSHVEECSLDANEVEFVAEEKSRPPASEMFKEQSGFEGGLDYEMSSAAGEEACLSNEELPGRACDDVAKEPSSSLENALETGGDESGSLPAVGKSVEQLVAFATLESSQDFAAAAKAIAAEAARLAVLDYAKRLAESGSVPLDLGELSKLGIAFEENKGGPQLPKTSTIEGSSECAVSEALGYASERKNNGIDANRGEKRFNTETMLNQDEVHSSDHLDAEEMSAINGKSKPSVIEDGLDGDSGNVNPSTTTEPKPQDMETEIEDINPFATSVATTTDKDIYSPLSVQNEEASWVDMTQPGQTSKAGNLGQDDHLDIFFRRKTPRLPEEYPMFDEERYSYPKLKPSFLEGRMPYDGTDLKKSSLQEKLFSKPLFDTLTDGQSTIFKESSDSSKIPVFDEGDGGLFESPVFDDGPEYYDDGVDNRNDCSAVADERRPQSPLSIKSPAIFDQEPEPCFDKVADDEELPSKERKESPSRGQLKWQSKKPVSSAEHVVTGNLNASDTSPDVSGNPMSRRSRRQPKVYDESKHREDGTSQLTSSSSLLQQQEDEPDRKDEANVHEKKTLGRVQGRPYVSSTSARSQRSSADPPKWVTSQADSDFPLENDWDSTSTKIPSIRTTKSPTRPDNRQRVTPEDLYFPENDDLAGGSAMTRKTHISPTRITRKQPMTHVYLGVEDDPVDYKVSYNMPIIPKVNQHDMVEDDCIEELQGKYKPSLQTIDLRKRTSEVSGFDSVLQQHHRQQKPGMRSEYKHSTEVEGESSRTSPVPTRLQPKKYMEEEPFLVSRHKPMAQDDEPSDYGKRNKSGILILSQLENDVDEDDEQHGHWQEEPGMGSKNGSESLRTRPMAGRQQQKKYIEEEEPILVSRYNPIMQDDEPLDHGDNNRTRISNINQLKEDLDEDKEQVRFKYKQYREDVDEGVGTRPMTSRLQPKKYIEEESYHVPKYTTGIQNDESLDYRSSNQSRIPKLYQLEKDVSKGNEGVQVRDRHQSQRDDSGERASASPGGNRTYQQRRQQQEDALESGYVRYEEVTAGGGRILTSGLSSGRKPSDFEEVQQVKSSPSRPLPSRQHDKKSIDEVEPELALRYSSPTATDGYLFERQEEGNEQFMPQMSPHRDSHSKRQNPGSQRQEQIQKDKQQSVSGHWQKQSMAEEEVHEATSLLEVQQEQVQQVSKPPWSPLYSHKQGSRLEDHSSKSEQQALEQQIGGTTARKERRPQEEGVSEQQLTETKPLASRRNKSQSEEGTSGKQDTSSTKSQLLTQQLPQSTSLPIESSISDPIVLATIPPPVKKPSTPSLGKLESSSSAPQPSKPPELKVPKLPQKPPNLDDLAANFEALRRARKGE